MTLEVPAELGDEFQEAVGEIDWQFKVEELPIEKEDPAPQTGIDPNFTVWFTLMGVALVAGVIVFVVITKKKKAEEAK